MKILIVLLIFLGLALAAIVSTSLFLGAGYVLACILPLSLFEGSLLAIGSSFVLIFSIAALTLGTHISRHGLLSSHDFDVDDDEDDEDGFDEDDENDQDDESERENNFHSPRSPATAIKIGRNDPCLCGSGLKYKRCCGK